MIDYASSPLSIIPPILALTLAIITRRVLLSLSIGIITGAVMLHMNEPFKALSYIKDQVSSLVYSVEDGQFSLNWDTLNILIFLILLGILTSLLSASGSNRAFVRWAEKRIKTRRGAKLLAASLVFVTFIDDYFHSLAVGAIARPVTDKFQVSRAKLAYILDSTAAPMCVIMPISSWGAYIITLISGILTTYAITSYSPMGAFLTMSSMNFYAIFSLLLVFVVAYASIDIGTMAEHEYRAKARAFVDPEAGSMVQGHVRNLVLPIMTLIFATIAMMMFTGYKALSADNLPFSILGAFENTTVGVSLVFGGSLAVLVISALIVMDRSLTSQKFVHTCLTGIQSMMGAILILCFAWTINNTVSDMKTGTYLASLLSDTLSPKLLPALLFLLGTAMAFSTGTSWGTFGIMLPIAAAIAGQNAPELMIPCLSAVMAGAVCGDHCSPVSDTTILSSTGAQCNHIDHVTTQLPYAILVAVASFIGYLALGFTQSGLAGFITTGITLAALVFVLKKPQLA
ncbi:MAG: Na+/H+ antiporter NhaC family protein [Cardiobacteriaceae bacterium]|nr:Na+/H+ antiporter NhaC family protein [Cardiobacteriaceae bacterium]